MAYSSIQWEIVRAFYERGLSLSEIIARTEVEITDRSTISKEAKKHGWVKGSKSTLIDHEVNAKQMLAEAVEKKSTLNSTELSVHDTLVDEKTKDLIFIRKASLIVAQKAVHKVQNELCSMQDLRNAQEVIGKGKENIYGKQPEMAIQINNSNEPAKAKTLSDFYGE